MSLRTDLTRLAHSNPELRANLLPLLRKNSAISKALDLTYDLSDIVSDIQRMLPTGSIHREVLAVKKALYALEAAVKRASN